MYPIIKIFNREIPTYAIMALVGIFVSGIYATRAINKKKKDDNEVIFMLLIATIGVFIGGHLLYGIVNFGEIINIFKNIKQYSGFIPFAKDLLVLFSGQVFYGGLIGGIIAGLIYAKKKKLDSDYYDIMAPTIPLFHSFARVGCFLGGCCYGIPSKFGFTYHNAIVESANNISRFPVQLLEALLNFILFLVLNKFFKKEKFKSNLMYIYLCSYAVIRFLLEFLRGDTYRGKFWIFSTSQLISILIIVIVTIILLIKNKKSKNKIKATVN